jgi:hypothetical protein
MTLPFPALSDREIRTVQECLNAVVEGPFIPEWEFQTLFGVDREVVRSVYLAWQRGDFDHDDAGCAVIGALNHLLGYPHGREGEWSKYISANPDEVRAVLASLIAKGL